MKKVLVSGYYGFGNTGDEAILETLSNEFKKNNIEAVVLSVNPEQTEIDYGIKGVKRFSIMTLLKEVWKSDALVSGGGSLFQDITSSISLYYYLGIVWLALIMRKDVHIFSQGIGPINKKINRYILSRVLNNANTIIVRDKISLTELQRLRITKPKISLSADPVFILEEKPREEGIEILREAGIVDLEGAFIGLSFRDWKDGKDSEEKFAQIADGLIDEFGVKVVFFPFHYPHDLEFSKKVASKMKNKSLIIEKQYKPSQIISAISLMDINLGVRLHFLIFSAKAGVPVAAISYDPKIDGFMDSLGLKPSCTYEDIKWSQIKDDISKMIKNLNKDSKRVSDIGEEQKKLARENMNLLMEELKRGKD